MGRTIPERIRWAVETLAIECADRVLEIGGGSGVTASLVCERLDTGLMLLVDRSATAVERTRRRNAEHVASGRLTVEAVELRDFEARGRRFDKVFAVNVNVFLDYAGNRRARTRARRVSSGRDALPLLRDSERGSRARSCHARRGSAGHERLYRARDPHIGGQPDLLRLAFDLRHRL
jgi:Methyltransferase domain